MVKGMGMGMGMVEGEGKPARVGGGVGEVVLG